MKASLTLTALAIGYEHVLLSQVSCRLYGGILVALLGRNGTGKTTLLKTLAGHLKPRNGIVEVGGYPLASLSGRRRARSIAYLPSHIEFDPFTTVYQFIEFGRFAALGWLAPRTQADRKAIETAAETVGVAHLLNCPLAQMSDGERQRVSIAQALAQESPHLLLDEPTAYLDFCAKQEVAALLRKVSHAQNKLILYATHDLILAYRYADRFLYIEDNTLTEVDRKFVECLIEKSQNG